jgi:transposase-like protein
MTQALFSLPRFTDDKAAREHLEALRWPNGSVCPHCGGTERNSRLQGATHRPGLWFCGDCREQFTVTVGTVFERSKVPLHKWVLATHLICSSKKGISAHQLHRTLGVTYKTAWFMSHRIREAMGETPEMQDQRSPWLRLQSGGARIHELADCLFWYFRFLTSRQSRADPESEPGLLLRLRSEDAQKRGEQRVRAQSCRQKS